MSHLLGNARSHTRRLLVLLGAALITLLALGGTAYGADGAKAIKKIDKALNQWKALEYSYKIVTQKAGESPSVLELRALMRQAKKQGYVQQLIYIEGGDLNGTRVLTKKPTQMYIYLPAYKKIRRIASHMTEQGFLGTSLSQRDLTLTRYGKYYQAEVLEDQSDTITLSLTAKENDAPYPKIELVAGKDSWLPIEIRYFNDKGAKIKTETRKDYVCGSNGYCAPKKLTMVDHTSGVTSTLMLTKHDFDAKISKKLFTKRSLQK